MDWHYTEAKSSELENMKEDFWKWKASNVSWREIEGHVNLNWAEFTWRRSHTQISVTLSGKKGERRRVEDHMVRVLVPSRESTLLQYYMLCRVIYFTNGNRKQMVGTNWTTITLKIQLINYFLCSKMMRLIEGENVAFG